MGEFRENASKIVDLGGLMLDSTARAERIDLTTSEAVSYTHLDVYKRQALAYSKPFSSPPFES